VGRDQAHGFLGLEIDHKFNLLFIGGKAVLVVLRLFWVLICFPESPRATAPAEPSQLVLHGRSA
jgi:hypothetical protein